MTPNTHSEYDIHDDRESNHDFEYDFFPKPKKE